MQIAKVTLSSATPFSESRPIDTLEHPKKDKETADAYETRMWRHRMHVNSEGHVEIPAMMFLNAIRASARRLQIQIPGKGKTQYTKYFEAGIDALGGITLAMKRDDVPYDRLFVPANGVAGDGKRVWKMFPRIDSWSGSITFLVHDHTITKSIFSQVIASAGMLVGIGRFRPEKRGYYGRFRVDDVDWNENGDEALAGLMAQAAE